MPVIERYVRLSCMDCKAQTEGWMDTTHPMAMSNTIRDWGWFISTRPNEHRHASGFYPGVDQLRCPQCNKTASKVGDRL